MSAASRPQTHTGWNFAVIVLDASFFMAGWAFVDAGTVMPKLVLALGGSNVTVGLMGTIQRAGWLLPQLLAASFVLHRPRKKPFVFYPCLISRLPFYALAAVLFSPWGAGHRGALLALLIGGYAIFCFGDGLSGVPWHDIISRTIPATLRGRFFGSMQFLGGLLAFGAGLMVHHVLSPDPHRPFPSNYGLLFAMLCLGLTLSTLCLGLIREPRGAAVSEARSLPEIIRSLPGVLRAHPRMRQLILAQNLCGLSGLAVQFYAVYAYERLGLPDAAAGTFVNAGVIGAVGFSLIWAYLSDRRGSTRVIRGVAIMLVVIPGLALAIPPLVRAAGLTAAMQYCYAIVFLFSAATAGGWWMGFTNYTMEISPEQERPIFLGMQTTLSGPTVIWPLVGGALLKVIPFQALFAIVMVTGLFSAFYVRCLPDPRHPQEPA